MALIADNVAILGRCRLPKRVYSAGLTTIIDSSPQSPNNLSRGRGTAGEFSSSTPEVAGANGVLGVKIVSILYISCLLMVRFSWAGTRVFRSGSVIRGTDVST